MADSSMDNYIIAITGDGANVLPGFRPAAYVASSPKSEDKDTSADYILAGADDKFLNHLYELAEKDTVILPGLRFNAAMNYGGGITYGRIVRKDGEEYLEPFTDKRIDTFLERNKFHEQFYIALLDIEAYGFAVFQYGFNLGGEISRISSKHTRAPWCRFKRKDKLGNIPGIYLNADFGTTDYKKENNISIDCIPEFDQPEAVEALRKKNKKEFAQVIQMPDLHNSYYPMPDWYSSVLAGWYDVGALIAESKKFMFKNQFAIKYHIEFHPKYWESKFGTEKWNKFTDQEKATSKKNELDAIIKYLSGADKTGSSLYSEQFIDRDGKPVSLLTVNELKNNFMQDGQYMKEANESSDHKFIAMKLHPELMGNAPGSKMGSGSGSASRVAFNQRVSLSLFSQHLVLDALRVVRDVNKWGDDVRFMIRNSLITTLDTGAEATKPKAPLS